MAEILIAAAMVTWAANFIVAKEVIGVLPPVAFTFLRFVLATATLFAILRAGGGSLRPPAGVGRILALGALGFGLYQVLWTVGLQSVGAGDSALLIASTPVLTGVIAVLIGTDSLSPTKAIGVGASFGGVVIVVAAGVGIEFRGSAAGFALTLGAALCWAIYTAVGARFLRWQSALVITAWATFGGTLVLAPIGIGQLMAPGAIGAAFAARAPEIVALILFSGVIAAAISNVIVFNGVRLVGPTRVVAFQSLVPILAVVLAFLLLGEAIGLGQLVGGAIIVGGVALTRVGQLRPVLARRRA